MAGHFVVGELLGELSGNWYLLEVNCIFVVYIFNRLVLGYLWGVSPLGGAVKFQLFQIHINYKVSSFCFNVCFKHNFKLACLLASED